MTSLRSTVLGLVTLILMVTAAIPVTAQSGLLPNDKFNMRFIHDKDASPNTLTARIFLPIPIEGCAKVIPHHVSAEYQKRTLVLKVEQADVLPDINVKNRGHCQSSSIAYRDVKIDHARLLEQNIKYVRIVTKFGAHVYDAEIDENHIRLVPKFNPTQDALEYWMLPENAVVLSAPMLDKKENPEQKITALAKNKGLIPITDRIKAYTPAAYDSGNYYFLDEKGDVLDLLKNSQNSFPIGQIETTELFYGPEGQYNKKIPVSVIASLPGEYD